jgi:glucose/mannose transport system permease protein
MRQRWISVAIVTPALLASLVFVYLFIVWTGYASLTAWNQIGGLKNLLPDFPFVGLGNYQSIFATERFWPNDIVNTIVFTVCFVALSFVVGLLLAILLDQKVRGESIFRNIFLLPMALSFVVTGTIWAWIFNPQTGINQLLDPLGLNAVRTALLGFAPLQPIWSVLDALHINILRFGLSTDPRSALATIVIAAAWQMSGFVMAMFLAGLRGISEEIREAARVDGASEIQIYWKILIPQLRPVIISVIVLLGYISLKIFDLVFVMTRGGPGVSTDFPSIFLFDSAFKSNQWARGAAVAVVMLLISAVVVLPYLWSQLRPERTR